VHFVSQLGSGSAANWTSVSPCLEADASGLILPDLIIHPLHVVESQHAVAVQQGLTLVHFSAQREHFWSNVVVCFAGFSDKHGSG
jgi:hypothetical protein